MAETYRTDHQNVFVVGVDMENRSAEEIARDAAKSISDLMDALVRSRQQADDKLTEKAET
ncbi:MAG: hypothetical protein IJ083_08605 [Clostridia bacterium]|nr:hypothetical protein [Clostridia bacterium]